MLKHADKFHIKPEKLAAYLTVFTVPFFSQVIHHAFDLLDKDISRTLHNDSFDETKRKQSIINNGHGTDYLAPKIRDAIFDSQGIKEPNYQEWEEVGKRVEKALKTLGEIGIVQINSDGLANLSPKDSLKLTDKETVELLRCLHYAGFSDRYIMEHPVLLSMYGGGQDQGVKYKAQREISNICRQYSRPGGEHKGPYC